MDFEVSFQDGVFMVVTSGDAEVMRFREYLDETFAHESWQPGMPILHDHSQLNSGPLTVDDIRRIADFCAESRAQFGHTRMAVVAGHDLEYGLARMWGTFVDGRWDVAAQTFRTRDDALRWLLRQELDDEPS